MTGGAGRRAALAVLLAAAVALPGVAGPAGAAACAGVHSAPGFAAIDLPVNAVPAATAVEGGRGTGGRDVLFAAVGRTIVRSPDGGCTWAVTATLDGGPTGSWRTSPTETFWSVGVGPAGPGGAHAVYALAGDPYGAAAVALPVVTFASRDDGAHWTAYETAPAQLTADTARCSQTFTTVTAGPVPGTAYLFCHRDTLGELALTIGPGECPSTVYVSTDYAATWRPVTARLSDPAAIAADNVSGCPDVAKGQSIVVDPATPHAVWRLSTCDTAVRESHDDGRTMTVYGTLPGPAPYCSPVLDVGAVPRVGHVALSCDGAGLLVMTKAGAPAEKAVLHVRAADTGEVKGCALLPGTTRALAFVYDTLSRCRWYAYDLVRKAYAPAGFAPKTKDGCAWARQARLVPVPASGARGVYARSDSAPGQLYRIGGR